MGCIQRRMAKRIVNASFLLSLHLSRPHSILSCQLGYLCLCAQAQAQSFASLHPCTKTFTKFIISSNPFWTDIWIVGFVWWGGSVSQACVSSFDCNVKCVMEMALDKMSMDTDTHRALMVSLLSFSTICFENLMRCNNNNKASVVLIIQSCLSAERTNARLNVCPACCVCVPVCAVCVYAMWAHKTNQ